MVLITIVFMGLSDGIVTFSNFHGPRMTSDLGARSPQKEHPQNLENGKKHVEKPWKKHGKNVENARNLDFFKR